MAIYRQIYIKFWNDDAKVADDFTPEDKYFYLYLLTNPHTNLCGCYELSFKVASRETGYNEETVKRLVYRMADVHKVIQYDEETREVLVCNWHRYNWTKSKDLIKAIEEQASYIKSPVFRSYIEKMIEERTVGTPSQDGGETSVHITVHSTDTDHIKEIIDYLNEKTGKAFKATTKTTKEVISARLRERFSVDDFKRVIDIKVAQWGKDPKMQEYLRPQTLFGTKMESYLQSQTKQETQIKTTVTDEEWEKYCKEHGWND